MSRHARYTLPDIAQHVVQRGNNRQAIFLDRKDYHCYTDSLQEAAITHDCEIHAYVFLRNHAHLLITQRTPNGTGKLFQSLGRRYVRYFNDRHGRSGTLWEGRYQACLVESERYLLACHRFMDLHPLREGMVDDPADHAWSSYHYYAQGKPDALLTPHPVYERLGNNNYGRQQAYQRLIGKGISKNKAQMIRETLCKSSVLGDERFKTKVEALIGQSVRPQKRGRPRRITADLKENFSFPLS